MPRGGLIVLILLVLAFAIFAAWSSSRRTDYFPQHLNHAVSACEVAPGVVEQQVVLEEDVDRWLSAELADVGEPSLYRRPASTPRSVRLTWLGAFRHPVVVRVDTLRDGRQQLTALKGPAGAGFGPADDPVEPRKMIRLLTPAETAGLRVAVEEARLFSSPSSGCRRGIEEGRVVLEGADPRAGYRYRSVQSPKGDERALGLYLLSLAGWDKF
jgi:hypothetical protein